MTQFYGPDALPATPNQQCQSTEGKGLYLSTKTRLGVRRRLFLEISVLRAAVAFILFLEERSQNEPNLIILGRFRCHKEVCVVEWKFVATKYRVGNLL